MGTSSCSLLSPSIHYIYCTDTILDRERPDTINLTNQSLARLEHNLEAPPVASPRRPEPTHPRQPLQRESKPARGGMDSEKGTLMN